jgi:hypothetical protein
MATASCPSAWLRTGLVHRVAAVRARTRDGNLRTDTPLLARKNPPYKVSSFTIVLTLAPPVRLERTTYGFEVLKRETHQNGDSRPSDSSMGALSEQSPDAVWGPDNSVADALAPDKNAFWSTQSLSDPGSLFQDRSAWAGGLAAQTRERSTSQERSHRMLAEFGSLHRLKP